jgi:hypothetical protein
MNRARLFPLVATVFAIAITMAVPATAQTVGAGPYYPTPSWDQKLQCDTQATCPRFIVLSNWNNEAVLDRETGLVWERAPDSTGLNWRDAHFHCMDLNAGGRGGWHLPTIQELRTVIDPSIPFPGPSLPAGHPFNVQNAFFWSATTRGDVANFARGAVLFGGGVTSFDKGVTAQVWCVRGGQGVDPQ